jgi:thiol-disulfide isomerase/thioredoxin
MFVSALGAVSVVAVVAYLAGTDPAERPPVSKLNVGYTPPTDSVVDGVRHVFNSDAAEHLNLDGVFPDRPALLLWFQGFATSADGAGGAVALDGAGGAVRFDERLSPHRIRLRMEGRDLTSIASRADGAYWVVDAEGKIHDVDREGNIIESVPTGFVYATAVTDLDGSAWISRSSRMFAFRLASRQDPLLVRLGPDAGAGVPFGSVVLPDHVLLAEIANAGHVAVGENAIYFAPFIRDEVVAFSRDGDTLWIAHRGLPQTTDDPRIEIGDDGPTIDYAPVNLGITVGPDGMLYVLSVPGFTTSESRLDVLDPVDGTLVRSTAIADPLPTLAADAEGRVYELDPFRLLTGVAPAEREPFAGFDLERMSGGRMTLEDLTGKVVLINFWASWCAPCREEMPALDSLRHTIDHDDFLFITMNEDVTAADARRFIDEFGFDFPVLMGKGDMQEKYHYFGLPFTVAIDRQGRVLQRWIGFMGEEQIEGIRAVIQAELLRGADPVTDTEMDIGGEMATQHGHRGQH